MIIKIFSLKISFPVNLLFEFSSGIMTISWTLQEALNKILSTCLTKPIATLFETLFSEAIPVAHHAPLMRDATTLFAKHWSGAYFNEITVSAHDAVELFRRAASKWHTNFLSAESLLAHAAELQAQLATLESNLANPVNE